ncbi:AMP-binding protein, partial [Gordonia sp. (in: high G+C Gram-positive bacteria)]
MAEFILTSADPYRGADTDRGADPDRVALAFDGRRVGYQEFSARVAVLARILISRGVGPDAAVGVCIDRSVEMLVAIHAIVAAGG